MWKHETRDKECARALMCMTNEMKRNECYAEKSVSCVQIRFHIEHTPMENFCPFTQQRFHLNTYIISQSVLLLNEIFVFGSCSLPFVRTSKTETENNNNSNNKDKFYLCLSTICTCIHNLRNNNTDVDNVHHFCPEYQTPNFIWFVP